MLLKGKLSYHRMVNGYPMLKIYLQSYHPLSCPLNTDNIYLKRSGSFTLRIVKTSSVQTPHKKTLHLHLNDRGGTDLHVLLLHVLFLSCMSMHALHATQAPLQRHLFTLPLPSLNHLITAYFNLEWFSWYMSVQSFKYY